MPLDDALGTFRRSRRRPRRRRGGCVPTCPAARRTHVGEVRGHAEVDGRSCGTCTRGAELLGERRDVGRVTVVHDLDLHVVRPDACRRARSRSPGATVRGRCGRWGSSPTRTVRGRAPGPGRYAGSRERRDVEVRGRPGPSRRCPGSATGRTGRRGARRVPRAPRTRRRPTCDPGRRHVYATSIQLWIDDVDRSDVARSPTSSATTAATVSDSAAGVGRRPPRYATSDVDRDPVVAAARGRPAGRTRRRCCTCRCGGGPTPTPGRRPSVPRGTSGRAARRR